MKKVILDTNIYGKMVIDDELDEIKKLIKEKVVIYGADVVRKEIRKAPRWTAKYPRNLKMDLLRLYDSLVRHTIQTTPEIIELAGKYYVAYASLGGKMPQNRIRNDLIVVACASMKGLDIVISEDTGTMLGRDFWKIYNVVNKIVKKRSPGFLGYEEFKTVIRRSPL